VRERGPSAFDGEVPEVRRLFDVLAVRFGHFPFEQVNARLACEKLHPTLEDAGERPIVEARHEHASALFGEHERLLSVADARRLVLSAVEVEHVDGDNPGEASRLAPRFLEPRPRLVAPEGDGERKRASAIPPFECFRPCTTLDTLGALCSGVGGL
jgi:hypothetical protein